MMHGADVVAMAYRYPTPNAAAELADAVDASLTGLAQKHMRRFIAETAPLTLGKWEELHTATLDLSPQFVPYVGHVVWGESYRRGEFMADLKAAMREAEVDLGGELPDHIEPILRYLAAVDEPLNDLIEVLPGAITTMTQTLSKASADNPYRHLLAATTVIAQDLRPVTIGGKR